MQGKAITEIARFRKDLAKTTLCVLEERDHMAMWRQTLNYLENQP